MYSPIRRVIVVLSLNSYRTVITKKFTVDQRVLTITRVRRELRRRNRTETSRDASNEPLVRRLIKRSEKTSSVRDISRPSLKLNTPGRRPTYEITSFDCATRQSTRQNDDVNRSNVNEYGPKDDGNGTSFVREYGTTACS